LLVEWSAPSLNASSIADADALAHAAAKSDSSISTNRRARALTRHLAIETFAGVGELRVGSARSFAVVRRKFCDQVFGCFHALSRA
jgi:hypothetical protein